MLALFGATVLSGCPTGDVVVYDKWEVAVNLPAGEQFDRPSPFVYNTTYLNPVAKISLPMPSTAATATVVEVPGFYYQHVPATPGVAGPAVKAVVLFRFAPSYVGLHTVALTVNGVAGNHNKSPNFVFFVFCRCPETGSCPFLACCTSNLHADTCALCWWRHRHFDPLQLRQSLSASLEQ